LRFFFASGSISCRKLPSWTSTVRLNTQCCIPRSRKSSSRKNVTRVCATKCLSRYSRSQRNQFAIPVHKSRHTSRPLFLGNMTVEHDYIKRVGQSLRVWCERDSGNFDVDGKRGSGN